MAPENKRLTPDNRPVTPEGGSTHSGDVFHRTGIRPDERTSEAVVQAVAAATGEDPTRIDPLYESINPDALNELFQFDGSGRPQPDTAVQFDYAGFSVVVRETGIIELR
ncbi:HalOD1 output domain-containing protein [Halomicrococcus gelatinilyticus]|uniref:HalOD1 output domain-containing protein n=1 Tax=Halomicrococcus gelatinilyticus TaxID=1702103 RepID=UPI002E136669